MDDNWTIASDFDTQASQPRLHNPLVMNARVLVVEDDLALRSALIERLESLGFTVNAAADGVSALELLHMVDHDAVLLDLGIPRMSGIKFLHEIRCDAEIAGTPIVVLTGSDEQDIDRARRLGAFAVHRKPSNAKHIAQSLRAAVYHG